LESAAEEIEKDMDFFNLTKELESMEERIIN